ncbi:MAG: hypothetical protein ACD_4C00175G0001 [uncultured bacterium (gcode 4)]|uniref:Uncharacterized protein n=1 Tax=uncultured bacterium (gcode 4) TaxID=1234023 RepID=K2FXV8_9BACT|nr:MAG: hypothetical protein ACD_4C00175G0001 [uncultured bacterium (gcode 4)]
MWEKAFDISIKLTQFEDKIYLSKLKKHDYQFALGRLIVRYNDPINIFERYKYKDGIKNYTCWENAKFIEVLNEAKKEFDPVKRMRIIEKAESILLDEMPITPLYFYNYTMLKKNYVNGIYSNIVGDLLFDETSVTR